MKKYFVFLTLLFLSTSAYTQILIDDGPIIINKKTSIAPDYVIQGNSWNHRILPRWREFVTRACNLPASADL